MIIRMYDLLPLSGQPTSASNYTKNALFFFANKHDFSTEFSGKCILIRFFIFPFSQLKFMCFVGPKLSNRCKDTRRHIFGQYRSFQQYFEKRGNLLGAKLRWSISKLCVFSVRQYFSFSLQ